MKLSVSTQHNADINQIIEDPGEKKQTQSEFNDISDTRDEQQQQKMYK